MGDGTVDRARSAVAGTGRGGFRVETDSAAEQARYVFLDADAEFPAAAEAINAPRVFLKACATPAVMQALGRVQINRAAGRMLAATDDGRSLYETLGWRVVAPYTTMEIVDR